jgi:hypothetical protein
MINVEKGITKQDIGIQAILLDTKLIRNKRVMADTFNNYKYNINPSVNNPLTYLQDNFSKQFMEIH